MRNWLRPALLALALAAAVPARADQYGGFQEFSDRGALEPFCRDLGGLLGSATYHGGRSLGFSGFDVGARYSVQFAPHPENRILRRRDVKTFMLPWVQAEVGLPFRLDGFVRGISFEGLTIVGGGVRYGLLQPSDKPWTPQLLVSGVAHAVVHQYFSMTHQGGSVVLSAGTPKFTPYIGGGFDRTTLLVRSSTNDPTLNGTQVTTIESRGSVGMQLRPWQFAYLNVAFALLHGRTGAEAGLGIRF
jgi:hypothetical protein